MSYEELKSYLRAKSVHRELEEGSFIKKEGLWKGGESS